MGAGGLRRKTSYLFGAFLLVCGGLTGAALANGAPAVGLPTTGITTSVTVPSVTVTVPTPTVTVPTPTVTVTVPTPTVTTPVTTVSLPPATTAVAATVVATTVATPPVTLKTPPVPAVTVAASVASQPIVSGGVTVASAPARVAVAATGAAVGSSVATGKGGDGIQKTRSQTLGAAATVGTGDRPAAAVSAATIPPGTAVGAGSIGSGPPAQASASLAALSATSRAAAAQAPRQGPLPTADRSAVRPSNSGATELLSPLAGDLAAGPPPGPAQGGSVQEAQVAPNPRPAASWSSTDTRRVAGALAALFALGAIGLAAAARSSAGVAACAELSHFPFPRFRILPCPGAGHAARSGFEAGSAAAAASGHTGAGTSSPGSTTARAARGSRFPLPRIGGVLGTAFSRPHPWEILRAVALGLLAFANAVLLAIRWRIGRLHVP